MTTLILFFIVPILTIILLTVNLLFRVHRPDREKVTPYECGISIQHGQTRRPYTVQYYLVGILFLIFDLEIAVLYPIRVSFDQVNLYGFWIRILFLFILTIGFVYEFGTGALKFTER
jgi:NADH:ubiquinone oxidoreductase subunit 3 (subunit A)